MATNRQDVELRIRARDTSRSDLKALINTLKDLRSAQKEQMEAAKQGTATTRELENSYKRLESVGKSLLSQQGLITTWKAQSAALQEARERTQAAEQAQRSFQAQLAGVTRKSADQKEELRLRNRELSAASRAEQTLERQITRTQASLEKYGIGLERIDLDQRRIREALQRTNESLGKQDAAIEGYDAHLRNLHATEQRRLDDERKIAEQMKENERVTRSLAAAERERNNSVSEVTAQRDTRLAENEARSYVRFWEKALTERETAEAAANTRRQARAREIAAEEEAQTRRNTQSYVSWWNKAIDEVEAKEKAAAESDAATQKLAAQRAELHRVADEALATQRNYATLALTLREIEPNANSAARAIRNVLDPAGKATETLNGLEEQVDVLAESTGKIKGPVQDLKTQLQVLANVQKAVGQQAGMIDGYNRQIQAVRGAREEYVAARRDVRQLAEQMRGMDAPTAQMNNAMATAQTRLRNASQSMQNQMNTARKLREELRQAGIATNGLATAEDRLIGVANRARTTVDQLRQAHQRYGEQVGKTGASVLKWGEGERTTLSYLQRIRGEILGLTTAYVGLQGGINVAGSAIDAYKQKLVLQQRLTVSNGGDMDAVAEEMKYVMKLADDLAYSWETVGDTYSKFSIAARAGGFTQQEARYTYENIMIGARAQKMSDDNVKGILLAVEQMISKGSVQSEELKRQLGDRLAGAVSTFATATDRTLPELVKAMENGEVQAREILDFARQIGKDNIVALESGLSGVQAAEGRLQNAISQFYLQLAEGGFVDRYTDMLNRIAELLRSDEGQEFANKIGDGFEWIIDLIQALIGNLDTLQTVFSILATVVAIKFFVSMSNSIGKAITQTSLLIAEIRTLSATMATSGAAAATWGGGIAGAAKLGARAIPLIGQALILWDVGKIMYQQSDTFAGACDYIQMTFEKLSANIYRIVSQVTGALGDLVNGAVRGLLGDASGKVADVIDQMAGILEKLPGQDQEFSLAGAFRNTAKDLRNETDNFWQGQKRAWEDGSRMIDEIDKRYQDKLKKRRGETTEEAERDPMSMTEDPGAGVTKEERELAALNKELDKLQTKLDKEDIASRRREQKKSLSGRIAIIDEEFAPLRARAAGNAEALAKVEKLYQERVARERRDFATEQLRAQKGTGDKRIQQAQKVANKLAELEANLGVSEAKIDPNVSYAERLEATLKKVAQQYSKVYQEADKLAKLGDTKGAADARRQLGILQEQAEAQAKFKSDQDELNRLQEVMNARISLRETLLQNVKAVRDAGLMSEQEYLDRVDQINGKLRDGIVSAQEAVRTFAEAHKELLDTQGFDALMAQLDGVKISMDTITNRFSEMDNVIANSITGNGTKVFQSMADSMAGLLRGTESLSGAFAAAGASAANFFAQLMTDIAMAIIRQQILNALISMTAGGQFAGIGNAAQAMGGVRSTPVVGGFMSAVLHHNGGTVGSGNMARTVPTSYFANAPKFHNGGMPGLGADETAAILQKGEEVLTQDDPRNILNAGKGSGGEGGGSQSMQFVLVDDHRDLIGAMATKAGDELIVKSIRRNSKTLKQVFNK